MVLNALHAESREVKFELGFCLFLLFFKIYFTFGGSKMKQIRKKKE